MWRVLSGSILLGLLAVLLCRHGPVQADEKPPSDEQPSIQNIMIRSHGGTNSLLSKAQAALKADMPRWDDLQKNVEGMRKEVAELRKVKKPPRGEKADWDQRVKAYLDSATELENAAKAKSKDKAVQAEKKLLRSCLACHRSHRPE